MLEKQSDIDILEKCCLTNNLATYDPYDIWVTPVGIFIKSVFNKNKYLGIFPAAALTLWDHFINNRIRLFYRKREYPIVRAMAALTLLNLYSVDKKKVYLKFAQIHIDWLLSNSCKGYAGHCWGLGFKWAAGEGLDYNENTPFSTHTPYALEALDAYIKATGDFSYVKYIESIFLFYENNIKTLLEDDKMLATSYGPTKDRLITNAVSYTMYTYAIFLDYMPSKENSIKAKIEKLYNFIVSKQRSDGSWLYDPEDERSFIDCFHSCFILKNIYKTHKKVPLDNGLKIMSLGYEYIKLNFYEPKDGLFKRFSLSNKPSIVKYDLYDNAEVLNLAIKFKDKELISSLDYSIKRHFILKGNIYSVIDFFNLKRNKNTLRWAALPYLYSLSKMNRSLKS